MLEEVDAAVKEVNEMLGDTKDGGVPSCAMRTSLRRPLLCVERRCINGICVHFPVIDICQAIPALIQDVSESIGSFLNLALHCVSAC